MDISTEQAKAHLAHANYAQVPSATDYKVHIKKTSYLFRD
jgi:hypothetical protein